ncbi:hypothetical protein BASA81_006817 [Batrachochytrium salamandrivorans]|nr:hypothetical protein BASA81_006817 [Batrachochytrium salamandrivorans]
MEEGKLNANPTIHRRAEKIPEIAEVYSQLHCGLPPLLAGDAESEFLENGREEFDSEEVFDLLRKVRDPEHPLSLEELNVVRKEHITVDDGNSLVVVVFTPTVPHCSMSTLIGLCLRVKLLRSLPIRFKVDIFVEPGSHVSEQQVNKQLNDKERVAAALENGHLLQVLNKCLVGS